MLQYACKHHLDNTEHTAPANSFCYGSFFQVATKEHMDPIEVETQALLLGAKVARTLNLQDVSSLTDNEVLSLRKDNEVLAIATQAGSPRFHPGHWSIRSTLALLAKTTQGMKHSIINIRRQSNGVAHRLAKQARLAAITKCLSFLMSSYRAFTALLCANSTLKLSMGFVPLHHLYTMHLK